MPILRTSGSYALGFGFRSVRAENQGEPKENITKRHRDREREHPGPDDLSDDTPLDCA